MTIQQREVEHVHLPEDDEEVRRPDLVRHRELTPEQWNRFEGYVAEMFGAFGMRPDTPGTKDTPRRFVRALYDATEGYEGDPKILTAFPTECKGGPSCHVNQIVEGPIPFFALCEHHAFPFYGETYVGYVAHEQVPVPRPERSGGAVLPLPPSLPRRYGGELRFPSADRPWVFANFVTTIDGLVSFALPGRSQASLVSLGHPADRFVLALLRACADAVLARAGPLRADRN